MLSITNLYADYGGKPALEEINLTLASGELLVVHPADNREVVRSNRIGPIVFHFTLFPGFV